MIQSALRRFLRRLGGHLTQGLAQKKDVDDLYDMHRIGQSHVA